MGRRKNHWKKCAVRKGRRVRKLYGRNLSQDPDWDDVVLVTGTFCGVSPSSPKKELSTRRTLPLEQTQSKPCVKKSVSNIDVKFSAEDLSDQVGSTIVSEGWELIRPEPEPAAVIKGFFSWFTF